MAKQSTCSVMPRRARLAATACLTAIAFSLGAQTQAINPKVAQYSNDPDAQKISVGLLEAAAQTRAGISLRKAQAAVGGLETSTDGAVLVEVVCTSLNGTVLGEFALPGVKIVQSFPAYKKVILAVSDLSQLSVISKIPEVGMVTRVSGYALTGDPRTRGARAMNSLSLIDTRTSGVGQKVGILSDSFALTYNTPTSSGTRTVDTVPAAGLAGTLADSFPQSIGVLPRTVQLVRDDMDGNFGAATDEGEAMGELIYQIAPGAQQAFQSAVGGAPEFMADGINCLRTQSGCTVMVDDVIYFKEPMYQDGPIAIAAANAVKAGIPYFSSAGNFGDLGINERYVPVDPGSDEQTTGLPSGKKLQKWSACNDGYLPVFFPAGSSGQIVLQWNQPWWSLNPVTKPNPKSGSQVDLDLYLTALPNQAGLADPVAVSKDAQGCPGLPFGDAYERASFSFNTTRTLYLAVNRYYVKGTPTAADNKIPVEFRLVILANDPTGIKIQGVNSETELAQQNPGPTMYGHCLATGVVSVAAIPWWEAPAFNPDFRIVGNQITGHTPFTDPELFTSRGSNSFKVLFDPKGNPIKKPRSFSAPTLTAPDGCGTAYFGSTVDQLPYYILDTDYDGVLEQPLSDRFFFGTSAASPNAAAVGALIKADPEAGYVTARKGSRMVRRPITPAELTQKLVTTALDVTGYRAGPGWDNVSGAGLIDAQGAVGGSQALPNLAYTVPSGWSSSLVVNQTNGSRTDASSLSPVAHTFASFAIVNNGATLVSASTQARLTVDGTLFSNSTVPPLSKDQVYTITDVDLGVLAQGAHAIEVRLDATNTAIESNEGDNLASKQITVQSIPNIAFVQPLGWATSVVVNQTLGSHDNAPKISNMQTVYVSYAITNNGSVDITSPFTVELRLDGNLVDTATVPSLAVGGNWTKNDISLGIVPTGPHAITATADTGNVISEGIESDNQVVRNITVGQSPTNDNFAAATTVDPCNLQVVSTNDFATKEAGETLHAGNRGGSSVWYRFTTPASDRPLRLSIDTIGSDFNTLLGLYTGTAVNNLTFVAACDDIIPNGTLQSGITVEVPGNQTYYIAIDGYNGEQGNIVLNLSVGILNDDFADAALLLTRAGTTETMNFCATKETGEPNHAGDAGGASLWYRWVAPQDGTAMFTTSGSRIDTLLGVYTGSTLADLAQVAANDDLAPGLDTRSYVTFPITQGVEYLIAVDGKGGAKGNITLSWSAGPSNDFFGSPTVLPSVLSGNCGILSSNVGAGKEPDEPTLKQNNGGASVWFQWTAPGTPGDPDYSMTFHTVGSTARYTTAPMNTIMAVFGGPSIKTAYEVASNDDINPVLVPFMKTSRCNFVAKAGETYHILVDGFDNEQGVIALNWDSGYAPINDFLSKTFYFKPLEDDKICCQTTSVLSLETNRGACREVSANGPEPLHANQPGKKSVWYTITIPGQPDCGNCETRKIHLTVTATTDTVSGRPSWDAMVGVYIAPGLARVGDVSLLQSYAYMDDVVPGSNTNVDLSFIAVPGTYHIAVDGKNCDSGDFELYIENAPAPFDSPVPAALTRMKALPKPLK